MFQFTHPGKGATKRANRLRGFGYVSIHAPWEGCDHMATITNADEYSFNSRTLGRVRQIADTERWLNITVSIHAPWEGCDLAFGADPRNVVNVSIHAPWEGCDSVVQRCVL